MVKELTGAKGRRIQSVAFPFWRCGTHKALETVCNKGTRAIWTAYLARLATLTRLLLNVCGSDPRLMTCDFPEMGERTDTSKEL